MADAPAATAVPPAPSTRAGRLLIRLDRAADRRWFLPALAAFPLSDYVLPFLPNQMLLMGVSALHPRRWPVIALTFVTASVVGAFVMATAIQSAGPWLLEAVGVGELPAAGAFVTEHGALALAVLSLLPWTPRVTVLLCALAGLPPWSIALAILAGRPLPMTLLAVIGARAPHLLRRFRRVDRVLAEVRAANPPRPGHATSTST
ncbi:hypothetical protein ACFVIM_03460 [Streptomyces sp. NPDC057638]|uniref:hypothetical protein n=1 Tax=Streptomyces sp. NPDC057638 TaxID=3346190 RepID=UPI0036C80B49